jgi:cytochrome P450
VLLLLLLKVMTSICYEHQNVLLLLLSLLLVFRLTDAEITSNILLVLLAGHDTSSTTLTRCLSNLHDHPWVLDKLRAEQAAVRAARGEALTPNALKEMPFADAVLRYASVLWGGLPKCCLLGDPSSIDMALFPAHRGQA